MSFAARPVYASADIYFFPSHTEAFPNTMLEAQASALTLLAPAYSVNRELVVPGAPPPRTVPALFALARSRALSLALFSGILAES